MIYELGTEVGANAVDVFDPQSNAAFLQRECRLGAFSESSKIYNEEAIRLVWSYRVELLKTCKALLAQGDTTGAIQLNDYSLVAIPIEKHPIAELGSEIVGIYLDGESREKGVNLLKQILGEKLDQLEGITQLESKIQSVVQNELEIILSQVETLFLQAKTNKLTKDLKEEELRFKELGRVFLGN